MLVRFWGTRGSIAKPGQATSRYGGNTSCVEVTSRAGTLVVIDCGTGAHALGHDLLARSAPVRCGHLLISHTHWDHIQGFPFFAPLFVPGGEWHVYGPKGLSQSLRETLAGQMQHTYFPITLDQLGARIAYHDLVEGTFSLGDIAVSAQYLNHPALTLGYRLEADGATVVYACDHEPAIPELASGCGELAGTDDAHVAFLTDADLVIHDAQYTAEEYPQKIGWGHSTVEYVTRVCAEARARRVVLTHHDPLRHDEAVDHVVGRARALAAEIAPAMIVDGAAEGATYDMHGGDDRSGDPAEPRFHAMAPVDAALRGGVAVVHVHDPSLRQLLASAASQEGLSGRVVRDASSLEQARGDGASVWIIEHAPPAIDALALVRSLRAGEAADAPGTPIIVATADQTLPRTASALRADWLLTPCTVSYARTRIRSSILRLACRWLRAGLPPDEEQRLRDLRDLELLDTAPEERFDRITRIAAATFDVPIALVTLVDRERQWFKSCQGLVARETPRDMSFCAHAVQQRGDVLVPDTLADDRFADNPAVVGEPRIRFYAGAPLVLSNGSCVGTLCIADQRARRLAEPQVRVLHDLRDLVVAQLERAPTVP